MQRSLRKTSESFITQAKLKHGNKYDYSLVDYKGCYSVVRIVCPLHGEFSLKAYAHLSKNGCPKCGEVSGKQKLRSTTEKFIEKARKVHGDLYNYTNVNYIDAKISVIITCHIHGNFQQVPNYHLTGNGCTQCYKENSGFGRKEFMSSCKNGIGILYIIKCIREEEVFYKVGITSKSVQDRFKRFKRFPYNYEILFELKDKSDLIFDLEKRILRFYRNNRYTPLLDFRGNTECFLVNHQILRNDITRNAKLIRKRTEGIVQ